LAGSVEVVVLVVDVVLLEVVLAAVVSGATVVEVAAVVSGTGRCAFEVSEQALSANSAMVRHEAAMGLRIIGGL
jgi:hypothetical protein